MIRITAALLLTLLAASAAAAPPEGEPTVLEPIEVTPIPDPLDGLNHLRKSLPCMGGCEGDVIEARKPALERAARYFLLPAEPKEPTDAQKEKAAQFCQNPGPGMDYYCLR